MAVKGTRVAWMWKHHIIRDLGSISPNHGTWAGGLGWGCNHCLLPGAVAAEQICVCVLLEQVLCHEPHHRLTASWRFPTSLSLQPSPWGKWQNQILGFTGRLFWVIAAGEWGAVVIIYMNTDISVFLHYHSKHERIYKEDVPFIRDSLKIQLI